MPVNKDKVSRILQTQRFHCFRKPFRWVAVAGRAARVGAGSRRPDERREGAVERIGYRADELGLLR